VRDYDCEPANWIPIQKVQVMNISGKRIPIYSNPDSASETVGYMEKNATRYVKDFYMPDTVGFYPNQIRWRQLGNNQGWIDETKISNVPDARTVVGEHSSFGKRFIDFSDGTCKRVPYPGDIVTVPAKGKFARVAHDWERPDWDYKPRTTKASPETVPMWMKPDFLALTKEWQKFYWKFIIRVSHACLTGGQYHTAWGDITAERKALTDNHGITHGYTDYITRVNIVNHKPIMQKGLLFGGSLVKIKWGTTIKALDLSAPPPTVDWILAHPWLWGWATVIEGRNRNFDKTWPVVKWPQFKKFGGWGVPYLIIGPNGENKVHREDIVRLENGSIYSPYVPKNGVI